MREWEPELMRRPIPQLIIEDWMRSETEVKEEEVEPIDPESRNKDITRSLKFKHEINEIVKMVKLWGGCTAGCR